MLRPVPNVILLIRNSETFYSGESEGYGVWNVMPRTMICGFFHNVRIFSILTRRHISEDLISISRRWM